MAESAYRQEPVITDTGLWRLVIGIGSNSLDSWLKDIESENSTLRRLTEIRWNDGETLRNIENAVYDNPLLLDDFEADIVITTDRYMLMPADLDDDESLIAAGFNILFPGVAEEDIMTQRIDDMHLAYVLTPGLRSFLMRTFPGARISSHIAKTLQRDIARHPEGAAVEAYVHSGVIDITSFCNGKIFSASTRKYDDDNSAAYHIFNALSLMPHDIPVNVKIHFTEGEGRELTSMLSGYIKDFSTIEDIPEGMSPAAEICCNRKKSLK